MGIRSFFSNLLSRKTFVANIHVQSNDNHEQVSKKLTDLGLLPAIKINGEHIGGADWSKSTASVPSANLRAHLDILPTAPPAPTQEPVWVSEKEPNDYIQRKFEKFHAENPKIMAKLIDLAYAAKASGYKQLGIASLFERLRWHETVEVKGNNKYTLDNSLRSRYARRIMKTEPGLRGFFRIRELY